MSRGFSRKHTLTKDTLLKIAKAGLFTIAALSGPQFASQVVLKYFKEKSKEAARMRAKKLWELKKRNVISLEQMDDGSIKIILAHKGRQLVRQYQLEDMRIVIPKSWDRTWRMIIYDIPQERHKASRALSSKLRQLGLYQFQKSVWISPYECLAELEFICAIFELPINEYIFYFAISTIPKEKIVKEFFGLH